MVAYNAPLPTAQLRLNVPITSPVASVVSVGAASVAVIGANQNRRGIVFVNPTTNITFYVVPSNLTAVAGQGVIVLPGGQVPFISDPNTNISYNCGWNGIASGGTGSLTVLELL